jgi:hypothetical protein
MDAVWTHTGTPAATLWALPESALRRWPGKINDRVTKYLGGLERELRRIRQTDAGPMPGQPLSHNSVMPF